MILPVSVPYLLLALQIMCVLLYEVQLQFLEKSALGRLTNAMIHLDVVKLRSS